MKSDCDGKMVCPECGHDRFSWLVTSVQFGTIPKYDEDDEHGIPLGEQDGEVVDSDTDPVHCLDCEEEIAFEDLVFVEISYPDQ